MFVRPRAKVNLSLGVGPRGADGYHQLRSVFLRIGLADALTLAFSPGPGGDVLTVGGPPECPVDGNLVLRALAAVRRAVGHDLPPLVAHLEKHIPMDAGLGGGSSDGAGALEAGMAMWGVGLAAGVREPLERDLGADVPFFARNAPIALVTGRGEGIETLPSVSGETGVLLVTPLARLSTAAVFARFDDLGVSSDRPSHTEDLVADLRSGVTGVELCDWSERLRDANDLWTAAASLEPGLDVLRATLERRTERPWLMSGSGSTLFALYPSPDGAAGAARVLVAAELDELAGATINAVDLVGPDPVWRYPWPSEQ